MQELVTSLPAPRNRINAPRAMERTDALLADAWRAAGWQVGRQHLRLRNLKANLDHPVEGSRGRHSEAHVPAPGWRERGRDR